MTRKRTAENARQRDFKDALDRGFLVCGSSIQALAIRLDVSRQAIYHWLKGSRTPRKAIQASVIVMFPPHGKAQKL